MFAGFGFGFGFGLAGVLRFQFFALGCFAAGRIFFAFLERHFVGPTRSFEPFATGPAVILLCLLEQFVHPFARC